jgi:hypothetical protein
MPLSTAPFSRYGRLGRLCGEPAWGKKLKQNPLLVGEVTG